MSGRHCAWTLRGSLLSPLVLMACAAVADDQLIVGAAHQAMSGADGQRLDADWVRSADRFVLSAGLHAASIGPNRWTLLGANGMRRYGSRLMITGGVDTGPADLDGESTQFSKLRFGANWRIGSRWSVQAEDEYVDVGDLFGNSLTFGATAIGNDGFSFSLTHRGSVSGNLDVHSTSFRMDYRAQPPYVMAGFSIGESNNQIDLQIFGTDIVTTSLRQAFVGITLPADRHELTLSFELGEIGSIRRAAFGASVRLPLGRERSGR